MGAFIGRKDELSFLDEFYNNSQRKACAVIGRRQIGKSSLIKEFIKDKENFIIEFIDGSLEVNLLLMSNIMSHYTGVRKEYKTSFDFVWDLAEYIKGKKAIIIFDEFPYIVSCDPSFAGITQHLIDMQLGDSKLIISGSSIKTMDYETADYSRPLYGRTVQLRLKELTIEESIQFHPHLPDMDQIRMYLSVGGVPMYHLMSDDTYRNYIEKMFLSSGVLLKDEGEKMILRELSPAKDYVELVNTVRGRKITVADIVSKTGINRTTCARYLDAMKALDMISECHPMWGAPNKPKYYSISDNMLAFSYMIKRNDAPYLSDPRAKYDALNQLILTFHGLMFEQFCMKAICKAYPVREIGSWWGKGRGTDEDAPVEYDIDVAAEVVVGNNIVSLAVECKFVNRPIGLGALKELDDATSHFKTKHYLRKMVISPSGFTEDLEEYAIGNNILLVNADMLLGRSPMPRL